MSNNTQRSEVKSNGGGLFTIMLITGNSVKNVINILIFCNYFNTMRMLLYLIYALN